MHVLYQRCAAVDIGKDVIAVAVRLPGDGPEHRQTIKRTFKTFYGVLKHAARWLTEQQVTHVAMEATGIYSMPVYHALLAHGRVRGAGVRADARLPARPAAWRYGPTFESLKTSSRRWHSDMTDIADQR